ncbi:MAG TPA: Fe-S-containing protein [Candidatus Sulfobium mesophilum]|nr:Fe-S-containing protein [Candidatus Sulfobium mesophilum]
MTVESPSWLVDLPVMLLNVKLSIYNFTMRAVNATAASLSILALFFFSCSKMPVYPQAPFDGVGVRVALKELQEKEPVFYTFFDGKNSINYFVLKLDGSYQSYFDACAKCYHKKMGYRLAGNRVVCRACDVNYSLHDLKEGIGSCYPIRLEGRVDGDVYVIDRKAILGGGKYF